MLQLLKLVKGGHWFETMTLLKKYIWKNMTETQPQVLYKPHCRNGAFILLLCTDPITEMGVTHTVGHSNIFFVFTYAKSINPVPSTYFYLPPYPSQKRIKFLWRYLKNLIKSHHYRICKSSALSSNYFSNYARHQIKYCTTGWHPFWSRILISMQLSFDEKFMNV